MEKYKWLIGIGVSLLSLSFLYNQVGKIDWILLQSKMCSIHFLIAIIITIMLNYLRAYRWRYLLAQQNIFVKQQSVNEATFIGMWLSIISTTAANDIAKPYYLSKVSKVPFWSIMGSCFIERFFDGVYVFTIVLIAATLYEGWYNPFVQLTILMCVLFFTITIIATTLGKTYPFILKLSQQAFLLQLFLNKLNKVSAPFIKGANIFRFSKEAAIVLMLLTIAYWMLQAFANFFILFVTLSNTSYATFSNALYMNGFYSVSTTIPSAAGGLGTVNIAGYEFLNLIAEQSKATINNTTKQQFIIAATLLYLSNLFADAIAGGFYYFRYWGKIHD